MNTAKVVCWCIMRNREVVLHELHEMIDWFVKKHHTGHYYHEIFELEYEEFIQKYHSVAYKNNYHKNKEY